MRRSFVINAVLALFVLGVYTVVFAEDGHDHADATEHFDVHLYNQLCKKNIGRIISGNIDVKKMMANMDVMLEQGVEGAEVHMKAGDTPALEIKMMKMLIDNAERMKSLSVNEIDEQWHEGAVFKAEGIEITKMDPLGEAMRHMELIVYPAEAMACLKQYEKTNDEGLLNDMKQRLMEARDHLKHMGE